MLLEIKILGGKDITVEIPVDADVTSLKQKIERLFDIDFESQKLLIKGRPLTDDKKLSDYKISNGNKLNLIVKKSSQKTTAGSSQQNEAANTTTLSKEKEESKNKYGVNDFWKTLERLLANKYSHEEGEKIMIQYKKDYDSLLNTMSLDDIERVAKQQLNV